MQTNTDFIHISDLHVPLSWKGLFKAFTMKGRQLQEAELWFNDVKFSKYGNQLDWKGLLNGLSVHEPVCGADTLKFLPVFMHLSQDIQHHLLAFFLQHRHELPTDCVQEFISNIDPFLEDKESWNSVLFKMLSAYLLLTKTGKGIISNDFLGYQYQFSSLNKEELQCLNEELKSRSSVSPYQYPVIDGTTCSMRTDTAEEMREVSESEGLSVVCKEEVDKVNHDVIVIGDSEEFSDDDNTSLEPPKKRTKIQPDFDTSVYGSGISLDHTVSTPVEYSVILSQDVMNKIDKLKEYWQNSSLTEVPAEIDIFLNSSPDEIRLICKQLQLNEMSELCLKNAFNSLSTLSDVMSHSSCVEILNGSIVYKILELKQSASRNLTDIIYLVAEKFSKPFIDSVVVNCVKTGAGNHQSELICKVTKDVFNNSAKVYLLKQIRINAGIMDENIISIFQTLVDKKMEMEGSDLQELLLFISRHSQGSANSTKFGKFLLAFVNKYGKQMTNVDLKVITEVIHCHGTFLKKSLESALKRVKPSS